jgi:protein gp37
MKYSRISWTDHTHNHWIGCTQIRPGCDHCYARRDFEQRKHMVEWGPGKPRRLTSKANRLRPLVWNDEARLRAIRYRVFTSSLSDVFDPEVPDEWRMDLFLLIRRTPHLQWMILTKRVTEMQAWFAGFPDPDWPWPHVSLGATIETAAWSHQGAILAEIPAARRFVSMEPLLGEVDCSPWIADVDEVIVGGENGRDARPMFPFWARQARDRTVAAGKTFIFKQWGDFTPDRPGELREMFLSAGWSPDYPRGGRVLDSVLWMGERR